MTGGRLFYFDFARALLMLLGLPYHIARIYGASRENPIKSDDTSHLLEYLADFLHSFRMEAFFFIAGFFSLFVLLKMHAILPWLRSRLIRICAPLITCTLLFAPIFAAIILAGNGEPVNGKSLLALWKQPGIHWVYHLWFLYVLAFETLLLGAIVAAIRHVPPAGWLARRGDALIPLATRLPFIVCASIAVVVITVFWMAPYGFERVTGVSLNPIPLFVDFIRTVQYFPFFALGALMAARPALLEWFLIPRGWTPILAIAFSGLYLLAVHTPSLKPLSYVGLAGAGLFWLHAILTTCRKHLDSHSPAIAYLCEASFTIYLFHLPIACALGLLLLQVGWPPIVEFLIILALTLVSTMAVHEVVRRSALLGLLFNGAWRKRI